MATIDDDLLTLERRMMAEGAGKYLDAIEELKRLVALGDPSVAAAIMNLTRELAGGAIDLGVIAGYAQQAYTASVLDNGAVVARTATPGQLAEVNSRSLRPPPAEASHILDDAVKAAVKARLLLAAGVDPATAAAVMLGNGRATKMALSALIVQHAAMGTNDVARIAKKPMVWVAERDACVRCLAHSGHVVKVGASFPPGLTYGPYDYDDAVKAPPLHPHCRCHLEVLNDASYAEALRREADRSILRGYSLESESMGVRVGAAKKLIASGVDAPKSVIGYGAKAVKAGEFPTRKVPREAPPEQPRHTPPPPPPPKPPKPPTRPPAPKAPTPPKAPPAPRTPAPKPPAPKAPAPPKKAASSAPKATPPKAPAATSSKAGIDLTKAKTPAEMAAAVQARHPQIDLSDWGKAQRLNAGQSRAALKTISDLADRFPGAKLTAFRPAAIPRARVMAWVRTPRHRTETGAIVMDTPDMEVALGYARDAKKHHEAVHRSSQSGHFHDVKGEDAMSYTITHEWGHVLDSNTQGQLSKMWARMFEEEASKIGPNGSRERYEWRKKAVSGYGTTSNQEGVAEAFADVEYNGANALPLNRAFYASAMEYLKLAGISR